MSSLGCFYWAWTWAVAGPAIALAIALYIAGRRKLKGIRRMRLASELTGEQAAAQVLGAGGAAGVQIVRGKRKTVDHFSPATGTLLLSRRAFKSRKLPHVAAACQEAGHALQHAESDRALALRNGIVAATRMAGRIGLLLLLYSIFCVLGVLCLRLRLPRPGWLVDIGVYILSGVLLAQVLVLPVEFDAARRALAALKQSGTIQPFEEAVMTRALKFAALDYVTESAWSVLWFGIRRRRRR